jgi:tetratricopeptide (TPR) repeat protein
VSIPERLRRWRTLGRLRRQLRHAPSPAAYGELAERYIALGETDQALRVAEQGLAVFPDSERLVQVRVYAKKGRLTGEIRKLREDLVRRPSPAVFSQLAEIYRELGSQDEALEIASECAEKFPLNENPYLIQGEIRLERFLGDMIAKDAVIAEHALQKVVRLNTHNVKAHLLLGELYYLVGALPDCRRHLRSVLTITPAAREVQELVRELDTMPDAETDESFAELADRVEEHGTFAAPPERFSNLPAPRGGRATRSKARIELGTLRGEVDRFGTQGGVRNVIVLDRDSEILADYCGQGGLSRKQFGELVSAVRATADDTSRRMDTGALVRAEIEGPTGNVTIARVRNLTLGVLYGDPLRSERAWELCEDFVAKNLTANGEAARA